MPGRSTEADFWKRVERTDGCWTWLGGMRPDGYGGLKYQGLYWLAHRLAYRLMTGTVPPAGFELDHLCRNRRCVNPAHLEPVTPLENKRRGIALVKICRPRIPTRANGTGCQWTMKTHCPKGHEYDESNTYVHASGSRSCRTCKQAATRRWREQRKISA